jgi:hypothetical protein
VNQLRLLAPTAQERRPIPAAPAAVATKRFSILAYGASRKPPATAAGVENATRHVPAA